MSIENVLGSCSVLEYDLCHNNPLISMMSVVGNLVLIEIFFM